MVNCGGMTAQPNFFRNLNNTTMTNPYHLIAAVPDGIPIVTAGLTKREYFAAAAMNGLLACPASPGWSEPQVAWFAIAQADELIKKLNETQP